MKKNIRSDFQSRQYMLSENYELYYYSDLHFKNVKIHSHNYYEFYFFLKGEVEMLLDGEAHPLTEGDIIVVPPGILHQARILDPEKPYSRIVFWHSRESYEALARLSPSYTYITEYVKKTGTYIFHFDPVVFNDLRSVLLLILDESSADRFGKDDFIRNYISELLLKLSRQASLLDAPEPVRDERTSSSSSRTTSTCISRTTSPSSISRASSTRAPTIWSTSSRRKAASLSTSSSRKRESMPQKMQSSQANPPPQSAANAVFSTTRASTGPSRGSTASHRKNTGSST